MSKTPISWTDHTINVVHGCSKPAAAPPAAFALDELEPGLFARLYPEGIEEKWTRPGSPLECAHCYAETLSNEKGWTPLPWREENALVNVQLHPERFQGIRLHPRTPPRRNFVSSMGDDFHDLVPDDFIREMLARMAASPDTFQLLTKRPERAYSMKLDWPDNVWLGTTCGYPVTKWRLEYLRRTPAKVRFLSAEPLLESLLPLDLAGIHQVIVGGESGPVHRPMQMEWARELRDLCAARGGAFFFKQAAGRKPGLDPFLVEADGTRLEYRQYPGKLTPPEAIE